MESNDLEKVVKLKNPGFILCQVYSKWVQGSPTVILSLQSGGRKKSSSVRAATMLQGMIRYME